MIQPMLCKDGKLIDLEAKASTHAGEEKFDGTRAFIVKRGNLLEIHSRDWINYTLRLPELVQDASMIHGNFTLDGEVICLNENGKAIFKGSQRRCGTSNMTQIQALTYQYPAYYMAFDILNIGDQDLYRQPYTERKAQLLNFLKANPTSHIRYVPHTQRLKDHFLSILQQGGEGLILKRLNSPYTQGIRSEAWLKIRQWLTDEANVVGWTEGDNKRSKTFGSLVLAKNGRHAGSVGSGFSDLQLSQISQMLKASPRIEPPFTIDEPYTAIQTPLRVKVRYYEKTENGLYRFPSFIKLEP